MSLFGRFMDSMRLSDDDDDDYFLDDDYEDERPPRKSLFAKKEDDYYDDYEEDEPPKSRFLGKSSAKVVPMKQQQRSSSMEVAMIKPTSIEDSKEISDYLLAGKAVVVNMEGLHMEVAQRIIDFTSGATYSINGNLQKISNYIFIATPESVGLSGDFQDLLGGGGMDISNMSGMNMRL